MAHASNNPGRARRAFTIVELLVVVLIAVILLTIAVPAFQSTIYTSNRSLAVNALQASSLMARDVAINTGTDAAVVFVYDPGVGRVQIIPAVKAGTIRETPPPGGGPGGGGAPGSLPSIGLGDLPYFDRDVFVPSTQGETLNLPTFWMVRGYAGPRMLLDQDSGGGDHAVWFNSGIYGGTSAGADVKEDDHWVFPETGFFPVDAQVNGGGLNGDLANVDRGLATARQSFMIRFDGRTGAVSRDTRSALFIDPRNSQERPWPEVTHRSSPDSSTARARSANRVDLSDDLLAWATRVLNTPDLTGEGLAFGADDAALREQLIGTASNDTVLVKPVTRVALYDERKLALAVGARGVNPVTNTIYQAHDQGDRDVNIMYDSTLFDSFNADDIRDEINMWIDGDTNFDGQFDLDDEPESRIYLIQAYTGDLKEVLR